jgi:uncharacterized protein YciI
MVPRKPAGQRGRLMQRRAAIQAWLAALALALPAFAIAAETAPTTPSPLFVVHFETGPSWNKSLAPSDQPGFREHSANLNRLRKEGTIVFGARYGDLGMIFLKADTLDAAKVLMEADPGVRSGIFSYRIAPLRVFYPWQP